MLLFTEVIVRAKVRNGRLVVDEPTDLPEGTEIELVAAELSAWLRGVPPTDESLSQEEVDELREARARAEYVGHEDLRKKLDARKI